MVDVSIPKPKPITSWWFQPIWKIFVKLDHFPRVRDENKKYLSCHHPESNPTLRPTPRPRNHTSHISDQTHPPQAPPWADFARGNISWKSKPARHNCNLKRPAKRPTGIGGDTFRKFFTRRGSRRFPVVEGKGCRLKPNSLLDDGMFLKDIDDNVLQQSHELS